MQEDLYRIEKDSFGEMAVERRKYWGIQTQRSLKYFSIGHDLIPLPVIYALALLKKAAAVSNCRLGLLDKEVSDIIVRVADEIIAGDLDAHFPLRVWMTGSGTQSNMNVNEVIANRAIEIVGGVLGSKIPFHPNDHINMSQSSNDIFPSAVHIAVYRELKSTLLPVMQEMSSVLWEKSLLWKDIIKMGRTHLQKAVPIALGQEFSGYAAMMDANIKRIEEAMREVSVLTLGGTAVGTGLNAPEFFSDYALQALKEWTKHPFTLAENRFAQQGSHDALVSVSGHLKTLANSLYKIANDLRLMSCVTYELVMPSHEAGSSIMPGKVNPTQCEALTMVAVAVMGYDVATSIAGSGGFLEMNVYKPLMAHNILHSIEIMGGAVRNFVEYVLRDISVNPQGIEAGLCDSLLEVTALSPQIGYDKAFALLEYASKHKVSILQANTVLHYMSEATLKTLIDVHKMAYPHGVQDKK